MRTYTHTHTHTHTHTYICMSSQPIEEWSSTLPVGLVWQWLNYKPWLVCEDRHHSSWGDAEDTNDTKDWLELWWAHLHQQHHIWALPSYGAWTTKSCHCRSDTQTSLDDQVNQAVIENEDVQLVHVVNRQCWLGSWEWFSTTSDGGWRYVASHTQVVGLKNIKSLKENHPKVWGCP